MIQILLGLLIAIYAFARKVVVNEPLRADLNLYIDGINKNLSQFKNKHPTIVLEQLLDICDRLFFYSFILMLLFVVLPKSIQRDYVFFVTSILFIPLLLAFSIKWIQYHKDTVKEYFLNFQSLIFLLIPTFFYYLGGFTSLNYEIAKLNIPFADVIQNIGIVWFQIIWIIVLGILAAFVYLGFYFVALPIYISIYISIISAMKMIMILEKHVDKHILDAIIGILVIVSATLKFF